MCVWKEFYGLKCELHFVKSVYWSYVPYQISFNDIVI